MERLITAVELECARSSWLTPESMPLPSHGPGLRQASPSHGPGPRQASPACMSLAHFLDLPFRLFFFFYHGIGWELFISVAPLRPST